MIIAIPLSLCPSPYGRLAALGAVWHYPYNATPEPIIPWVGTWLN
jgi:hypothetical protein